MFYFLQIIKERKLLLGISVSDFLILLLKIFYYFHNYENKDGIKRRQSEVFQVAKSSRNRLDFLDTLLTAMVTGICNIV